MKIETFPVYPLGCNCSILYCEDTKEAIIIDPGGDEDAIIEILRTNQLSPKYIIHTHAHFDHCMGTKNIADNFTGCSVGLHKEDLFLYEKISMQCSFFGIRYYGDTKPIDIFLEDEQSLKWGKEGSIQVIHTPGHTPGSITFLFTTKEKQIAFSGDTLFAGGIGRTDLWGGDSGKIIQSIKSRLLTLDDSTIVIPGHGDFSTIYNEKKFNPFLV